jgi:hypothetical protein
LVPVADRNRPDNNNQQSKNNLSISLLSNIVPQQSQHNTGFWATIESYTRKFVDNGYEVYVITGTDDIKKRSDGRDAEIDRSKPIKIPEHLWRVLLVLDHPGADVTPNTYTVGFWTENRQPTTEEKELNEGDKWKTSTIIKSVNDIELATGYDFFSNLPSNIQEIIENNREIFWSGRVRDGFISNLGLSSPLMSENITEVESSGISPVNIDPAFIYARTINDSAIGQNGIIKDNIINININADINSTNQISPSQIGIVKTDTVQISPHEVSIAEISAREIGGIKIGSIQVSSTEVSSFQDSGIQRGTTEISTTTVSTSQVSKIQLSTLQIGIPQISISQIRVVEDGSSKVSISKISPSEVSIIETNSLKVNSSEINTFKLSRPEILFPSSILLQKLFSIHSYNPALINTNQDNPLDLWFTLFDPTFNLTFQIADLPTGQLAEAQITNYDSLGRPNGGTILIDTDANGIGWFIDPTPWENTEFTTTLTDTAYRATTGDAFDKYDLLTKNQYLQRCNKVQLVNALSQDA